jgi:hypothetical protein
MAHRPRGTHDDVPASVVTALQAQAPRAVGSREPTGGGATTVIATATYVTGTARLEPGRRYVLALHATRLQILGPVDLDPMRVALERPVADLDARALEGRVILSDRGGSGMVLAFMSVAGTTVDELLGIIRSRARERGA